METKDAKRSLRSLVAVTLLLGGAVALSPTVTEAQIYCWFYPNSKTDDYSDFCYGSGPGCLECVIFEYSPGPGDGGGGAVDPLPKGAAAASDVYLGDQGASQPVGLTSGTGLPRLSLNEAACKEPRLDNPVRTARSERVPDVRKDRLHTRRIRELTR